MGLCADGYKLQPNLAAPHLGLHDIGLPVNLYKLFALLEQKDWDFWETPKEHVMTLKT